MKYDLIKEIKIKLQDLEEDQLFEILKMMFKLQLENIKSSKTN